MKRNVVLIGLLLLLAASVGRAESAVSLAGDWRFAIDPEKKGVAEEWFGRNLAGAIHLPGTMDDAGLGPKNTKKPTLEGPYRIYDYAGPAWYQRDIEIPESWAGKRITLFLERCRWVTSVWLDDWQIGSQDSLISPHVYDFGIGVKPGKHRLTICVDNTVKLDMGRFVSALFGGTWGNMNGIVGRIELNATPPAWIDSVQVYPDVDTMTARVVVKIGNATGKAGRGMLQAGGKSVEATWDETGGQAEVVVDMSGAKLWDEFSANLQKLTVTLGDDSRSVQFGMRKFSAKGTQFTLNDRPILLRGTLECSVWPLTGYPPTDVAAWQRIYRIMKSYGLNHIRFHSWCPPEAAFAAADIEGIMIQAEGPMANVPAGKVPARDVFIEAEYKRIVDTYGNHPSFCTMTLGNEFGGNEELRNRWIEMLIARDPRHLYSSASGFQKASKRQWTELTDGRGVHGPGTDRDLSKVVAGDSRPMVGHEIGQWMYWPDPNEIKKWTGVMALKNYEMIRDDMAAKHLADQIPQFVQACGKFATLLYKEEIEVLRRTQGYAGFSLLDLHDYPTQGTALIGPLDAFWESKGFITPEAFRRYGGPTTPLLRMPKRTYTVDELFSAKVDVSHFGPGDLANVRPAWAIKDSRGKTVASGELASLTVPTGKVTSLGAFTASLSSAEAPAKLVVTVTVGEFSNDWEIWVYPAIKTPEPPEGITVARAWDERTKADLAAGKSVVLFPAKTNPSLTLPGRFIPVFWSPVWFPNQRPNTNGMFCDPDHPAFAQFPTDGYSNWQWWELLNNSSVIILDDAPADYRPIVQIMDNFARNHKLGSVLETKVGSGKLLICAIDLPRIADKYPAARQLLKSLYAYAGSARFDPKQSIGAEFLETLFSSGPPGVMTRLEAKVIHVDSEHADHPASNVIDGDPDTLWHTNWEPPAPGYPHELVIEFPKTIAINGCTLLPRQDSKNGAIQEFAIYVSADGKQWKEPVAKGAFKKQRDLLKVLFGRTVEGRYLKFVAISPLNPTDVYASLAELEVIEASK